MMKRSSLVAAFVLAALSLAPVAAFAQAAQKVASANMQRIFTDSQERKDLENKFKTLGQDAQQAAQNAQGRLRDLQGKRDQFRPGSPDYERANQELTKAAVEAQVAATYAQQELVREQKRSTRAMVEKIVTAVDALAKEKGYTLVITQVVPPDLSEEQFDRMTPEQLNQVLSSRNVLYVAPEADLTAEVVARLDAAYKEGK